MAKEAAQKQSQAKPSAFDNDLFNVEYSHDIPPPTDTQDFVEGLLITSTMCVIYGESNSGKTFFATDLFLHVACGWAWNGREVERGAVIYCALEGAHGIRNRVVAFREEHGLGSHEIPFAVIPVTMDLLKPDADVSRLIATIKHEAAKLQPHRAGSCARYALSCHGRRQRKRYGVLGSPFREGSGSRGSWSLTSSCCYRHRN
jgi:hypothetical protein